MRILYLEDNVMHADLAFHYLKKIAPEFELTVASTLTDGLMTIASKPFDAALVDIRLPDGTGIEFISHIRRQKYSLPIVVLSGMDDELTTISALKAGADDYLVKTGNYTEQIPQAIHKAMTRRLAGEGRQLQPFSVTYVEHFKTDAELTYRHINQFAPHINLKILYSAEELLALLEEETGCDYACDVLLLDYRLPGIDALELANELRSRYQMDVPVILITGQGSVDIAVQAFRLGATDYVVKQKGYLQKLPAIIENAYHVAELQRQRANLQLALDRQNRLTRELFHRTRNNLQVISSIIQLQTLLLDDEITAQLYRKAQQRIKTMALVQDVLYENHDLTAIRLDTYLRELCNEIQRHFYVSESVIRLALDIDPVEVLMDIALPCGMIVTELLMNCYQHAFPDDRTGVVNIDMHRNSENTLKLRVMDNGVGVSEDFDYRAQRTYGIQSVIMLAEFQLQGHVYMENTRKGFSCTVTVRDDLYQARV